MEDLQNKNAIIYCRVSTSDQKDHGYSLESQREKLRKFCKSENIKIIKEFEEDYSAKDFNRPSFKELKGFAKTNHKKIDLLLCVDWDRFGRNLEASIIEIAYFKKLSIEINCINSWHDNKDPHSVIYKAFYLAIPEIDNKLRSKKIKEGIIQANKEGRYVSKAPLGYINGRDELNRTLIKPCPRLAPIINMLFHDYSMGFISQNQILTDKRFKDLNLSRSNLSRMLKKVLYAGKLELKVDGEKTKIIDALHEPIISYEIYIKTQQQLEKKSRYKQKPKKYNEKLPLRGHLKCSKCGSNLTGSGSTSKTGVKYYYYHCNSNKCKERFRSELAHEKLFKYFKNFKLNDEVKALFIKILNDHFVFNEKSRFELIGSLNQNLKTLKKNSEILLDKLIEGAIDNETYNKKKKEFDAKLNDNQIQINNLKDYENDLENYTKFSIELFSSLENVFNKCDRETFNEMMSSIFEEKLEFEDENYRTPKLNQSINFIYHEMSKLELENKKTEDNLSNGSRQVHLKFLNSNSFIQGMAKINDFKKLLIYKGYWTGNRFNL